MKTDCQSYISKKHRTALFLFLTLIFFLIPIIAQADNEKKIVRVGWYDSSYNTIDASGRRTGYAYEYQLKIAAYTGWSYEYVKGSWSDLLQMLINGDIDLMSDISYTRERAEKFLYPDLPMGSEEYFLFVAPDNMEITSSDVTTLNGKRVGVNRDSIQELFYLDWAERSGIRAEVVTLNTSEDASLHMLETGELDAYVTVDAFTNPNIAKPVCKVGSSDYYFAVSKDRPDLLADLNNALSKIQDENRYYNQEMFERYINTAGSNAFLSQEESDWLSAHGPIRIGYQDNYLAFCASDKKTGELTGAIKDFLDRARTCLINAQLDFEAKAYPTVSDALDALKRGEVDCVFPANFGGYDGEKLGIVMTMPLMRTDIYAVIRQKDLNFFAKKEHVIVAVNEGNPNYDVFLLENFPEWRSVHYPSTPDCLKAVADGMADAVLISSYRMNNLSRLCDKYRLTTFPTGIGLDYTFAVDSGNSELYSILSKAVGQIPSSYVNAALSFYITEDARLSLSDIIEDNLPLVTGIAAAVLLVILILLIKSIRTEKKSRLLIAATESDKLTGLYNRDYFFQYANRVHHEHPDSPMDAIVINIEQFHTINALNGREFGDHVLRVLGKEVKAVADEFGGIGGRFGADRFDIYCRHTDNYQSIFDRLQEKLDELSTNASISLRMGAAPWQEGLEPVQLFDRARTACSMARGHYKEHLIIFDESVRERELFEQRLLNDLRRALDNYEFEVYYQPKYDIREEQPKLVSAEALVRWNHPELGLIPPDDFIPLFERNGKIGEIDKFVWEQAAKQIARWQMLLKTTIPISINLSRVDVFDPELSKTVDRIVSQNGLTPEMLKLEVTESAYIDNSDHLIRVVDSLRRKGYTVEMDDFGTGYSSLNMLSSMPVDVLKMDRHFIRNIEHSEKDIQLVGLIVGIADNLKIPVIAEGVETATQLQILKKLGCTIVQGYYFSKPLHPADFETEFLQRAASGSAGSASENEGK